MSRWKRCVVWAFVAWLAGCAGGGEEAASPRSPEGPVEVNIRNDSDVDFDAVRVAFPGATVDYGAVPSGRESGYEAVQQAYRYAYVEAHAGDQKYVLQPIDYTGETLLEGGRYTYALNLSGEELTLALVRH